MEDGILSPDTFVVGMDLSRDVFRETLASVNASSHVFRRDEKD